MFNKSEPQSIEIYLTQVERELRDLPAAARAEEMREIESHLQTMIDARQDVAGVLAQFGAPRKVGRDLRRAWERKQPEDWVNAALALVVGCAYISIHNYFFTFFDNILLFHPSFFYLYMVGFSSYARNLCSYFLVEGLLSFAVGSVVGLISPKRGRIIIACIFPFLFLLDAFPALSIGLWAYSLSFSTLSRYAVLLCLLLVGARFGARLIRKHKPWLAK